MEVSDVKQQRQTLWQIASPFLVIAILVAMFFPTFVGLSSSWTKWDESLSHAYPLLLWFLVLLYKAGPIEISTQKRWIDLLLAVT
ncbi:MAG TPA: hypothetical protein VF433_10135, partial [Cellvibrio sp.]